jgi:hypothetical protein
MYKIVLTLYRRVCQEYVHVRTMQFLPSSQLRKSRVASLENSSELIMYLNSRDSYNAGSPKIGTEN